MDFMYVKKLFVLKLQLYYIGPPFCTIFFGKGIVLKEKILAKETLFLPMATILETGNHIAQNGDGTQRRECANRFVEQVTKALNGTSPFIPISFLEREDLQQWLMEFPDSAMQGRGLGDQTIIHDWQKLCTQNSGRRVYIWSLDTHLKSYEQQPRL